jgi:hypothetical protein
MMEKNEYVSTGGDLSIPYSPAIPADDLTFESALGPMSLVLTAKRITIMDGGIKIELLEPQREWFLKHKINKLKINDATFALEEK